MNKARRNRILAAVLGAVSILAWLLWNDPKPESASTAPREPAIQRALPTTAPRPSPAAPEIPWEVRVSGGVISNPNPEDGSGTPFTDSAGRHRYGRTMQLAIDPAEPGDWGASARATIRAVAVANLETYDPSTEKWISGPILFSASYSRVVEAAIDKQGRVKINYDDGTPATDPTNHLAITIAPNADGQNAVSIAGPHAGAEPYNIPSDGMNALVSFQKRRGAEGEPVDVKVAK